MFHPRSAHTLLRRLALLRHGSPIVSEDDFYGTTLLKWSSVNSRLQAAEVSAARPSLTRPAAPV